MRDRVRGNDALIFDTHVGRCASFPLANDFGVFIFLKQT